LPFMRVNLKEYIVVPVWFGCNNACSICMLADLKESLPPIGFRRYREVLVDIVSQGHFKNLILSGAEVTTCAELDSYIRFARSLGWFKKIQIQTNGRRLSDCRYLEHLIASGANEFFISVHGLEETHDALTCRPGAFWETMRGLANLEACADVNVITNTVLTKANLHEIPALIGLLPEKVTEIHLWNFFPMESEDTRDLVVSLKDFLRLLPQVLSATGSRRPLVLKGFPECLPVRGEERSLHFDNWFPVTVLPNAFWKKFSQSGFGQCPRRAECIARECWGLSRAYTSEYGDERDLLSPFSREGAPVHAGGKVR
jgi:MoaA/NifB/PqqE/SkfB family radical SAM enzyme